MKLGILPDYLRLFDIIGLTETLTDNIEKQDLPDGYKALTIPRFSKEFKNGCFHGMCFIFNAAKIDLIPIKTVNNKFITWCKVKANNNDEILIGLTYIPPEGSKNFNSECFEQITDTLLSLESLDNKPILIMGDFNARTGELEDFLADDEHQEIMPPRSNRDKSINGNGKKLIDFCRTSDFKLINGRYFDDKDIGEYTSANYRGSSTIDYMLGNNNLHSKLLSFKVDAFDACLSDVHSPITCQLKVNSPEQTNITEEHIQNNNKNKKRIAWNPAKANLYRTAFDNELTESIHSESNTLSVDDLLGKINDSIYNAATSAGLATRNHRKPIRSGKKHFEWFDTDCKTAKNLYNKVKRNVPRTHTGKETIKHAAREYKYLINRKRKNYRKELKSKLKSCRSNDPAEYWKLIKGNRIQERCGTTLTKLTKHFEELNKNNNSNSVPLPDTQLKAANEQPNDSLNRVFDWSEIEKQLSAAKNNKAAGIDEISADFLKKLPVNVNRLILTLFNKVLDTGEFPQTWSTGIIVPIYKNKGKANDPNNYRGITLLSALGKLFTACINVRLADYCNQLGIIGDEQAGFRAAHSTLDSIFVLSTIIEMYLSRKKRLYCAFVDFTKAFDTIDRWHMWKKLLANGINGKIFNVIKNMYDKAKACVKLNNLKSEFFRCSVGVRQGDNLSPLLFALYINDFELFLKEKGCKGLNLAESEIKNALSNDDIEFFVKLILLLYADDTVLLADTPEELQKALDYTDEYCKNWQLTVNIKKTEVMIFSRGKVRNKPNFFYKGVNLKIVDQFIYLGVMFNYDGKFNRAIEHNVNKATRAMFSLTASYKRNELDLTTQLDVFDKTILPILTYGCEIWGHSNVEPIEVFYRKFLKRTLGLRKTAPNCMVYGETGRKNIALIVKQRMITFWMRLEKSERKLSGMLHITRKTTTESTQNRSCWHSFMKNLVGSLGIYYLWNLAKYANESEVKNYVKGVLSDWWLQNWRNEVDNLKIGKCYQILKRDPLREPYLDFLSSKDQKDFSRFRCAHLMFPANNHEIESRCGYCNDDSIADEYHVILECPQFNLIRTCFMPRYYRSYPTRDKFYELMNSKNRKTIKNLLKFLTFLESL